MTTLLTPVQVMKMFQICPGTLWKWQNDGLAYIKIGRLRYFREKDIEEFINNHRTKKRKPRESKF